MAAMKDHGRPALQLGRLLALLAALSMAGAGVTHLRVTPGHWAEDRSYGAFFLAAGVVQLGGAAALAWRSWMRGWRWMLVAANLALVAIWALTRTAGVPVGVDAAVRETVGVADLLAVGLELLAVALLTVGLAWPGGGAGATMDRPVGRRMAAGVLLVGALVVAPLVAAARPAPVSPLCAGHAEQAALGPLGAVDGHSVLPRGTPAVRVATGQTVRVLAGELVNCADGAVTVERVATLNVSGSAARVVGFEVGPLPGHVGSFTPLPGRADLAPTEATPRLGIFARISAEDPGVFVIDSLRLYLRVRGRQVVQPVATIAAVYVAAPGR
jgi:hypothetical protein